MLAVSGVAWRIIIGLLGCFLLVLGIYKTALYPNQFSDPEAAIEEALAKLDIGYIDMMLLHHPGFDFKLTEDEMAQAVDNSVVSIQKYFQEFR